jgi:lipopolysaccharide biosynthesis protein
MKTMLNCLEENLIDGLKIASVKETNTKYKITFEFENEKTTADLFKTCSPNCEKQHCFNTIKTAMSTIFFNRGDFQKAKAWLDKKSI